MSKRRREGLHFRPQGRGLRGDGTSWDLSVFGECIAMPADRIGRRGRRDPCADLYLAKESKFPQHPRQQRAVQAAWGSEIEAFPEGEGWDKVMDLNR